MADADCTGLALYVVSFLVSGDLTSHLNVTLTLPYITRRIAATEFTGESRFLIKEARTISLAGRVQLIIVTLGFLPMLLTVATPIMFNWSLIERTRERGMVDVVELSRAVQQPLNSLIERMRSVAAGDFRVRTSVLSGDEIGVLKGHFNAMVEGLEERKKIRDTFGRTSP